MCYILIDIKIVKTEFLNFYSGKNYQSSKIDKHFSTIIYVFFFLTEETYNNLLLYLEICLLLARDKFKKFIDELALVQFIVISKLVTYTYFSITPIYNPFFTL